MAASEVFRPPRPAHVRAVLAAFLLAAYGWACGDSGSTELSLAPSDIVAVSPPSDTVPAGEQADPPVSVRVLNSLGDPIEGIPVRFLLTSGKGQLFPNLAVSNQQGIAEATYQADLEAGEASVRADIPSAPNVKPIDFQLITRPITSVQLAVVSGDGQRAETGSQLPLPFVLRITTPTGNPAGGIPVAWRVASGADAGARLTADTTYSDAAGRTQVLLTLGNQATEHVVEAVAAGGVASDTVRFTATAAADFSGSVVLDSVRPIPLRAGVEAVLFGAGFSSQAEDDEVRVEGEPAEILQTSTSELHFIAPSFDDRCRPARSVGVRAIVRGEASNGEMVGFEPRSSVVRLQVGEARTLRDPADVRCFLFDSASVAREYSIEVQSASKVALAGTSVRLASVAGGGPSANRAAGVITERGPDAALIQLAEQQAGPELQLKRNVLQELLRRRAVPASRVRRDSAALATVSAAPPADGDTLRFIFAVQPNLTATCSDTTKRASGVVRAAGRHFVLVEDIQSPAGGFTAGDWAQLGTELDDVTFPTDTSYFGPPADIDFNQRVLLFFTPEVNALTPRGSPSGLGGFFLPLDLAAARAGGGGLPGPAGELCPASNEGEVLYLVVPDPEGNFGDAIDVARARRNARGIVAHEFQHLINAEGRLLRDQSGFAAREEVWLDEGLSHLAEEVVGLRMLGLNPRGNFTFEDVAGSRNALDLFNAFQINNFFQLSLFMLNPNRAPALSTVDPGGFAGLQMRGLAWFFLRWLGDQEGGADERTLFRQIVQGGPNRLRGIENIELATRRRWEDLLSDFTAALAADDAGVPALPDRLKVLTWDFRSVFASLNRNPAARGRFILSFPLSSTRLRFETAAFDFDLLASTVKYFTLSSSFTSPALALSLGTPTGRALAEGAHAQVTIVRLK
ncbi:MAG: hypothetical protein ACE5HQ_05845 [Gemmatimonadota bacterium]